MSSQDRNTQQFLTKTIEGHLKAADAVGAAVAIARNGVVIYEHGFGLLKLEGPPVDPQTRFEIGSNTKQFTAAAILQLQERGRLSLDHLIARYVPEFPHARQITIRNLLNQTSGLPDFVMTNHFVHIATTTEGSFRRIEKLASGPLRFAPGSKWEYSNTNYIALGRILEVASRQPYHQYVREHLFAPAVMHDSGFIQDEKHLSNLASGYWWGMQGARHEIAPRVRESWAWSAGDIVSTVGDLIKWDAALKSGAIMSKGDFKLMTTPATLSDGNRAEYGFAWWIDEVAGTKHVYHDGDTFGMSASNNLYPDYDLDIVVLENESRDAAAKTASAIFRALSPTQLANRKRLNHALADPGWHNSGNLESGLGA